MATSHIPANSQPRTLCGIGPEISLQSSAVRYVVITPVRNEAARFEQTCQAIVGQTIVPRAWVIVDDGSKDGTDKVAGRYASQYPWISVIRRHDRGFRAPGSGVIEAFYDGYQSLVTDWDYLIKFDADLTMEADYFERCFEQFAREPRLGIGGGNVREPDGNQRSVSAHPRFHVRGATKIYRRSCWESIGGLLKQPGWDTLDEIKANMEGWETKTFANIEVCQLKHTGSADGTWRDMTKNGLANYIVGYHPLFLVAKCAKRAWAHPFSLGASAIFYGYVEGYFKGIARVDKKVIKYVRQQQIRRLLGLSSIWN